MSALEIYCQGVSEDFPETIVWMSNILHLHHQEIRQEREKAKAEQGELRSREWLDQAVERAAKAIARLISEEIYWRMYQDPARAAILAALEMTDEP